MKKFWKAFDRMFEEMDEMFEEIDHELDGERSHRVDYTVQIKMPSGKMLTFRDTMSEEMARDLKECHGVDVSKVIEADMTFNDRNI
jgi:hypothetical protein